MVFPQIPQFASQILDFPSQLSADDYRVSAFIDSTTKAVIMANLVGIFVVLGMWGGYRKFLRRAVGSLDTEETYEELEKVLSLMAKSESHFCGQRLICEIHARKDEKSLGKIERNVIEIFRHVNSTSLRSDRIVDVYKKAAMLGSSTNSETCRDSYHSCELQSYELAKIITAANKLNT